MDSEEILSSFRQEWQRELQSSSSYSDSSNNLSPAHNESLERPYPNTYCEAIRDVLNEDDEFKATELFNKGVQLEQSGKLYESITFYKRAISLVPDIEFIVHQRYLQERDEAQNLPTPLNEEAEENSQNFSDYNLNDLTTKFEGLFNCSRPLSHPNFAQESPHISCLPAEMLEKVLAWIVGRELDISSLECLARVCRGFYLLCRKSDIWKRACVSVWGINIGELGTYDTWREMYIWRPRPRFNGCYISRTTYFRSGEKSFQDLSYQPWHIVCYYRYMRFFPSGQVLMLTSSDEPQLVVNHLRKVDCKHPQAVFGHFRIHGSSLTMLFRRSAGKMNNKSRSSKRGQGSTDIADTTFQMELELKSVKGYPHWNLSWKCYSVVSSYYNGSITTSVVDVSDQNSFPQLSFSKVRSYQTESEAPLL